MILTRQRLQSILGVLGTAIGNKVMAVASYACFRIDRDRRKLFISTTDFHAFLTIDYGDLSLTTIDDVPDIFLIDYKQLTAIVRSSTTENVEICEVKGGKSVDVITNGTYRFNKWGSPEDFPQADFNYNEIARWNVPELQSAWNKVVVAVSKDVTKISYQGVNYDGSFAATDNRRLSVVDGPTEYDGEPMLLPPVFGDVIKNCKNQVSVGPNAAGNMFVIVCEEIGLVASIRLIEAKFQQYQSIIANRKPGIKVTVAKQDLIGAVSRLMIFSDQLYKAVNIRVLHIDGSLHLELSIQNKNAGNEMIESIDFDLNGAHVEGGPSSTCVAEFRYHIDNVLDGATVSDSPDEIAFDFQPDGKLWIDEERFHYLLTKITD